MSRLLFSIPAPLRPLLYTTATTRHASSTSLPRIFRPSTWASLIPKAFRRHPNAPTEPTRISAWTWFKSHPATPVLLLSLLVGSQAINTLALKNEVLAYTRVTEGRLAVLREVIERVGRGEDVDVEGALGTGRVEDEEGWFDVIKEIEMEEIAMSRNNRRREKQRRAEEDEAKEPASDDKVTTQAEAGTKRKPMFM